MINVSIHVTNEYLWKMGEIQKAYLNLNRFLEENIGEKCFVIDENTFFDTKDESYFLFLMRLLRSENRIKSFSRIFSWLWKDYPSQMMFGIFCNHDFSQPGFYKFYGLDELGYSDDDEDFDYLSSVFKESVIEGFVTNSKRLTPFDGKVHINFEDIREDIITLENQEINIVIKQFEVSCEEITNVSWEKIVSENSEKVFVRFLFELFGELRSTLPDLYTIVTGCLEKNPDWKDAIRSSAEDLLMTKNEEFLNELIKISCQVKSLKISGRQILNQLIDYLSYYDEIKFRDLYVNIK